ncbi:heterokaryon incompatibility protein-domain-containing protein [Immersiella caudata]|uniref:Heterokaryon incompatibility protein-domain-containing protein n=1 Tax=Immersiella caudata TaxID=314043 RepID=A0AA39XIG7_9PEZI|nr:heterokaryon incompatibility protein-domain-containing protein [Immersiella caudata]
MLCSACERIFSEPRRLAYGSISPWMQSVTSFRRALKDGCHLCNIIEENRSYNEHQSPEFPRNVNYAFKPLKPSWARKGTGHKWYAYQQSTYDDDPAFELADFIRGVEMDPTPNGLGALLATDADNLLDEAKKSWMVLEFLGNEHILLPMEICTGEPLERLAQVSLASQVSTGQTESLQLARGWLQNCKETHLFCQSRSEDWLPTRLIDVGTVESPILRLVTSTSLEPKAPYVALSHRWGANQTFILRTDRMAAYQEAIPTSEASATVRDAARVTRALGIRHLWVDCMCIIQDDDGQDWARESDTMFKVYGLSTCTIAAANSGDGEGGFLTDRNQYRVRPCHIPSPFKADSKYSFKVMSQYLNKIHDRNVRNSEWFNRGWVFQERMLAPRLLIFTKTQVLWGCAKLQAAETWPCGKTNDNYIDRFNSVEVEKDRLRDLLDPKTGICSSHKAWWEFLQDYMSSQLTVWSDRLAAIRGIAALTEDLTGERYCGGMWLTGDLFNALLWHVKGGLELRPGVYVAPSFSWAAVLNGTVEFRPSFKGKIPDESIHVEVVEQVQITTDTRYGNTRNIQEGLRLLGVVLPCSILTTRSGLGVEHVMIREEGVVWVERIRLEIEEAEREAARLKALEEERAAAEAEAAARQQEAEEKLAERRMKFWPKQKIGAGKQLDLIGAAGLRGGGSDVRSKLKNKMQKSADYALSKLSSAAELRFKGGTKESTTVSTKPGTFPRALSRSTHETEMRRRQREAEARAERVFADLDRGVKFEDPLEMEKKNRKETPPEVIIKEYLKGEAYMDYLMPRREVFDVFFLPLLGASGLLIREVDEGQYERIGMFSGWGEREIAKLPWPEERGEFLLV